MKDVVEGNARRNENSQRHRNQKGDIARTLPGSAHDYVANNRDHRNQRLPYRLLFLFRFGRGRDFYFIDGEFRLYTWGTFNNFWHSPFPYIVSRIRTLV